MKIQEEPNNGIPTAGEPEPGVPVAEMDDGLVAPDSMEADSGNLPDDGSEYEYVPLSEATGGIVGKVRELVHEYSFVLTLALVAAVCALVLAAGRQMGAVFIILAFALIAAFFAYLLYNAWQEKKSAQAAYERAAAVRDAVMAKSGEEIADGKAGGEQD